MRLAGALLLVLAALGPWTAAHALRSDRLQPIHISADNAQVDDVKRVSVYTGDVVITRGTLRITGNTVTVYYDKNYNMTELVSDGDPATFRQLPDGDTEYRTARAQRIEYFATKGLMVLLGHAVYGKGGTRVEAERIVYDTVNGQALAQSELPPGMRTAGGKRPHERVRITIPPSAPAKPAPGKQP